MIPSILQIRVGASLELVEEPVDLVDLPTEAPQLCVVGVALLYQLVGVLVWERCAGQRPSRLTAPGPSSSQP